MTDKELRGCNRIARSHNTAHERRAAANLVREVRAQWPNLQGDWTRSAWNAQAHSAGLNYLNNMRRFRVANGG